MRSRYIFLSLLVVFTFHSVCAQAQEASDWAGGYVGLEIGASTTEVDWYNAGGLHFDHGRNTTGIFSGLVGYRVALGDSNWLGGMEISYTQDLGQSDTSPCAVRANTTCSGDLSDALSISLTLAQPIDDVVLGYVRAGFTSAQVSTISAPNPGFALRNLTTSERESGFHVGLGADFRISKNILLGLNYTYYQVDGGYVSVQPSPPSTAIRDVSNPNAHVVGVRLIWQF